LIERRVDDLAIEVERGREGKPGRDRREEGCFDLAR
jgi:hypothetical protein